MITLERLREMVNEPGGLEALYKTLRADDRFWIRVYIEDGKVSYMPYNSTAMSTLCPSALGLDVGDFMWTNDGDMIFRTSDGFR